MTDNQPRSKISDSDKTAIKYVALAGGAFVFVCALLFAAGTWITPAGVDGYSPSKAAAVDSDGSFTITVNTSNRTKWVPVNLGAGRVAAKGEKPDLLLRRYLAQAPHGALDLGDVLLNEAAISEDAEWVRDSVVDGEVQNETLSKWYMYSYWTHLLEAKAKTYAVKLANGSVAYLRFVSYYCKPEGTGCMTLKYRFGG